MSESQFPYESWVEDALRSVLRRALDEVQDGGLPGEHHFYINFKTRHEAVEMPPFLRAQYPDEITIVLQHQFEDLEVDEDGFRVTLYFSGRRQRLYVPFAAVTSFADPSVNFGLQVGVMSPGAANAPGTPGTEVGAAPDTAPADAPGSDGATGTDDRQASDLASDLASDSGSDPAAESGDMGGAEVIPLDTFRKKS